MNICEFCGKENDGAYATGRFCNRICSNSFSSNKNNKSRVKNSFCIICNTKIKIPINSRHSIARCKKHKLNRQSYYTPTKCKFCGKEKGKKKKLCDSCKNAYCNGYRLLCDFDFNINEYKNEFDLELVKKFGWYSPSNKGNNLNGISKDHMFSVNDGFKYGISYKLIKHPANCKLMIHLDNNKKNINSSITLLELCDKIKKFEIKYKNNDTELLKLIKHVGVPERSKG